MLHRVSRAGFGMEKDPPYPFYFLKIPPFISNRRGGHDRDAVGGTALGNGAGFFRVFKVVRWHRRSHGVTGPRGHGATG
jgi:hypothetical protein